MASEIQQNCKRCTTASAAAIDRHIGNRIKLRRNYLKMSQDKLGRAVGLTFQQIQKYEKGFNRISVGRLWEISRILNVPIAYFFEDLPRSGNEQNAEISGFGDEAQMIYKEDSLRLLNAFNKIRNPQTARIVFDLLQALVATPKEAEYEPRKNNIKKSYLSEIRFFNAFKTYLCLTPVLC